jgi:hypothetical protein
MPMTDPRSLLATLQRPRLLIRAARHGLVDYRRDRDLRRLIGTVVAPSPDVSVSRLLSEEERMETIRCSGDAAYSLTRHIEVLIALMAEARLLPRDAGA